MLTRHPPGDSEDAYKQSQNSNQDFGNESSFGHEALAGAASFGAFKVFEDRQRAEGTFLPPFLSSPSSDQKQI